MSKLLNKLLFAFTGILLTSNFTIAQTRLNSISLFEGDNFDQWNIGINPAFEIKDSIIHTTIKNGSNLFTKRSYANFILNFDYLVSEDGNSGILIRCDPSNPWSTGAEIQLLAPWTPYRDDLHCTGSIYGHVAVTNRPDEKSGTWHHMEILCNRYYIRVSVDGKMITEAKTDTVKSLENMYVKGAIGIQSNHSKEKAFVKFKNFRILDLDENPKYTLRGFLYDDPRLRRQAHDALLKLNIGTVAKYLIKMLYSENPQLIKGSRQVLIDEIAMVSNSESLKKGYDSLTQIIKNARINKNIKSDETRQYLNWLYYLLNQRK